MWKWNKKGGWRYKSDYQEDDVISIDCKMWIYWTFEYSLFLQITKSKKLNNLNYKDYKKMLKISTLKKIRSMNFRTELARINERDLWVLQGGYYVE